MPTGNRLTVREAAMAVDKDCRFHKIVQEAAMVAETDMATEGEAETDEFETKERNWKKDN